MNEFRNYEPSEEELETPSFDSEQTADDSQVLGIENHPEVETNIEEDYKRAQDLEGTMEFYGMAMCIPEGYIGEDGLRKYSASSPENSAEARRIIQNCNQKLTNIANKYGIEAVKNGNGYVKISEKLKQIMEES